MPKKSGGQIGRDQLESHSIPKMSISVPTWLQRINTQYDEEINCYIRDDHVVVCDQQAIIRYDPNTRIFSGHKAVWIPVRTFITKFVVGQQFSEFLQEFQRVVRSTNNN